MVVIMRKQFFFITTVVAMTALFHSPVHAAGKIKCWVNKDGVKECGTYVPPEYSQKRVETRNNTGRVVEIDERAKTPEEIEQARLEAEKLKEQERLDQIQKQKDMILLNTYTTERDINLQRDSKIAVIDGFIQVTESNNKMLSGKLEKLQKQAANHQRSGKQPPANLVDEINSIERQIKNNDEMIASKHSEQEAIKADFDGYMKRFRELKGIKTPPAEAKPAATKPAEEKPAAATSKNKTEQVTNKK